MNCIEHISCNTAEEFIRTLRPTNPLWGSGDDISWIFRGQWNADWPLMPSVWRDGSRDIVQPIKQKLMPFLENVWPSIENYASIALNPTYGLSEVIRENKNRDFILDHYLQVAIEYELVTQFVNLAEELGYPILGENERIYGGEKFLSMTMFVGRPRFPAQVDVSGAFGFAQHHGIPTRLLDWTRRALYAAFFAVCVEARKEDDHSKNIAVWAFNQELYSQQKDLSETPKIVEHTVPRHKHSFLHAQDGLFQWAFGADIFYLSQRRWPSFEEILEVNCSHSAIKPLRKITVPVAEADKLLWLLGREKISRAHLMPTYDNITGTLKTKWKLNIKN